MYPNLFDDFDLDVQKVVIGDINNCIFSTWNATHTGCPPPTTWPTRYTCHCVTLSCDMICEMRADI